MRRATSSLFQLQLGLQQQPCPSGRHGYSSCRLSSSCFMHRCGLRSWDPKCAWLGYHCWDKGGHALVQNSPPPRDSRPPSSGRPKVLGPEFQQFWLGPWGTAGEQRVFHLVCVCVCLKILRILWTRTCMKNMKRQFVPNLTKPQSTFARLATPPPPPPGAPGLFVDPNIHTYLQNDRRNICFALASPWLEAPPAPPPPPRPATAEQSPATLYIHCA